MNSEVTFGEDARVGIKKGIDLVADAVKLTLGPRGRNVIIDTLPYNQLTNTNDGVTIAREIKPKDNLERTGAKLTIEAASKTDDNAGDGTTTTALLAQALATEGMKYLAAGTPAVEIRHRLETATKAVIDSVQSESVAADDLESLINVATISCSDPDIGTKIAKLVDAVGPDGTVTIEDNHLPETTSKITEGMRLNGSLVTPFFITNRGLQEAVWTDTGVFVTDESITNPGEMQRVLETAIQAGKKSLVIIAQDVQGYALQTVIENYARQLFKALPLKVVTFGEVGEGYLRDICAVTAATFISSKDGRKISDLTPPELGHAEKVVATTKDITILGGKGDAKERVKELKTLLSRQVGFDAEGTKERIAKLKSGVGVISVGGTTDTEREERKKRVEDAIKSSRAAREDGVVAGGGAALYRAALTAGYEIMSTACRSPLKQIAYNSGVELSREDLDVVQRKPKLTIDFTTGETVDAWRAGVIDPTKVVINSIRNAVSAASLFLVTEAVISATPPEEKI